MSFFREPTPIAQYNVNVREADQYQKRITLTCNSRELFDLLRDMFISEY
jgi:hypothetical protein